MTRKFKTYPLGLIKQVVRELISHYSFDDQSENAVKFTERRLNKLTDQEAER
jgi:hypothetical protein